MTISRGTAAAAALLLLSVLPGCGPADDARTDTPPDTTSEAAIDDGTTLGYQDYDGIEQENIVFNLPWVAGPITRDPAQPEPPVNEVQEVSTMQAEGFDRVIFRLGDGDFPGYHLSWAEGPPADCASNAAVRVDGEQHLRVRLSAVTAAQGALRAQQPRHENLRGLASTCVTGSEAEWHLGLAQQGRIRVFEMRNPRRLVVDVRHGR